MQINLDIAGYEGGEYILELARDIMKLDKINIDEINIELNDNHLAKYLIDYEDDKESFYKSSDKFKKEIKKEEFISYINDMISIELNKQ